MSGGVVFISSIFRDLVAVSPRFPKPGETILGTDFFMGFGGKGANQCVMAARLGAETVIVGKVGDDEHGVAYRQNLELQGIECSRHLGIVQGTSTGIATILVEGDTGENQIVIVPGANQRLLPEDVEKAEQDIKDSSVIVSVLEIDFPTVEVAFRLGRLHGVKTVLNAAPARREVPLDILRNVDILIVNQTEAEMMTGMRNVEDSVLKLLDMGCGTVIATLGSEGAIVVEGKSRKIIRVAAPKLEGPVVDTTGAGDAFVGSLVYFLAGKPDMDIVEMVRRSCLLASNTVMKKGTQSSYPVKGDPSIQHLL